jgi:hypothetical protein
MDSFEIIVKKETYKIIRSSLDDNDVFIVFNYAMCHVIKQNADGKWEAVEHRFGKDQLPVKEIGKAIDIHFSLQPRNGWPNNKAQFSNED